MLISLPLFVRQREKACSIQTMGCWIEIVAKELKEFCQVLAESGDMIDSKLL
jgi:hypothetical protein